MIGRETDLQVLDMDFISEPLNLGEVSVAFSKELGRKPKFHLNVKIFAIREEDVSVCIWFTRLVPSERHSCLTKPCF